MMSLLRLAAAAASNAAASLSSAAHWRRGVHRGGEPMGEGASTRPFHGTVKGGGEEYDRPLRVPHRWDALLL